MPREAETPDEGWEVLTGLNYHSATTGRARRVEPGQVVHDLPPREIAGLQKIAAIRRPLTPAQKAAERAALAEPDAAPTAEEAP